MGAEMQRSGPETAEAKERFKLAARRGELEVRRGGFRLPVLIL